MYPKLSIIPNIALSKAKFAVNLIGCNRAFQYDLALQSLALAAGTKYHNDVVVFASIDCKDQNTINVIKKWGTSPKLRVVYTESYQMHTNKQPKRLDERVARHWLSSNNRLFSTGYYDNVIYLESDHIVAPDFFEAAGALMDYADEHFPDIFMLNMGCHGQCMGVLSTEPNTLSIFPLQNIGVIYRRQGWEKFIKYVDKFCSAYGDWDQNLHSLLEKREIPGLKSISLGYNFPRVRHTTTCYTSRRQSVKSSDNGCEDPDKLHQRQFDEFISKRSPSLRASETSASAPELHYTGRVLHKPSGYLKPNADPEVVELCMEASRQTTYIK